MKPPLSLKRTTIGLLMNLSSLVFLSFLLFPSAAFGFGAGGKFNPPSLQFESYPGGMYYLQIRMGGNVTTCKFNKLK
jgi:hypothetical protein